MIFSLLQSNCPWAPLHSYFGALLRKVSAGRGGGGGGVGGGGGKNREIH